MYVCTSKSSACTLHDFALYRRFGRAGLCCAQNPAYFGGSFGLRSLRLNLG